MAQSNQPLVLIKQPEPGLCMACCVAMVAHTSLDDVLKSCRILKPEDGVRYLPNNEAVKFLASRMLNHGLLLKPLDDFHNVDALQILKKDLLSYKAIISVPSKNFVDGLHAVAWCPHTRKVFDPLLDEPSELSNYEIVDWAPITDF